MRIAAADIFSFEFSTTSVTRLLVVSYFLALGIGTIDGVDASVLATPFVSQDAADLVTAGIVILLSSMILLGFFRRAAALLLALVVFWASYLTMVVQSGPEQIATFWRDIALIGALLLTYGETKAPIKINIPAIVESIRTGKFLQAMKADVEQTVQAEKPEGEKAVHVSGQHPKRVKSELYRQDLAVIHVR